MLISCVDQHIRLYNMCGKPKQIKVIEARDVGWSIIDTDYSPDQVTKQCSVARLIDNAAVLYIFLMVELCASLQSRS